MSLTNLAQVTNQIQKYWAPMFTKELRESLLLGGLVNRAYEGEIRKGGDTVRVSQITAPSGEMLDVGVNADSFNSEQLATLYIDIVANKRAVSSYKFADLVDLQSQLDKGNPEIMDAMKYAMAKQVNDYLYSLISPSSASPDHIINSVATLGLSELQQVRKLAGQAKWAQDNQWYGLLDPKYYTDILGVTAATSTDFGATDSAVISGQIALPRFGFKLLEDNSRGASVPLATFFHPSFMHLVMQSSVQVKLSDLHPKGEFGYIMSVDMVFGAVQAVDGNVRCIKVIST